MYIVNKRVKYNQYISNYLYSLSFLCYLINTFLNHSMFRELPEFVFIKIILFGAIIIFLGVKVIFVDVFYVKELIIYFCLFLLACIISKNAGDMQLITLLTLVLGAKNVNFRYILIIFFITIILLLVFTYLSTLLEIIPNLQYFRIRDNSMRIRNSFGMIYPTVFSAYLLSVVIVYSYLMNVDKIINHIFLWALVIIAAYISLEFADARMSGYSIILYIVLYYIVLIFFRNINNYNIMKFFIVLCYPVGFLSIFYLSYYYDSQNNLFVQLDNILSGRLYLGYQALHNYPITLLGQKIEFIGFGGSVGIVDNYDYVDSSYLQFMLTYGITFTILSSLSLIFLTIKRLNLNDYRFIAIIFMISLNSIIEDRLLDVSINVYWIMILAYYNNSSFINIKKDG